MMALAAIANCFFGCTRSLIFEPQNHTTEQAESLSVDDDESQGPIHFVFLRLSSFCGFIGELFINLKDFFIDDLRF
jgi:hypothetical protein